MNAVVKRSLFGAKSYVLTNALFILVAVSASVIFGSSSPRTFYLILLVLLCSSPMLVCRRINDRYAMYGVFFIVYFVFYGMIDFLGLFEGRRAGSIDAGVLSEAELLILITGLIFSASYLIAARSRPGQRSRFATTDWNRSALLAVGLLFWVLGTAAFWYWNVKLTVRSLEFNNTLGPAATTVLMLGRYVQPLGLLLLAYAYAKYRSKHMTLMVIAVIAIQIVVGFVSDTKSGAMLGGILVILAGGLVWGRVPRAWLISGIAFVVIAFPIFQAYRTAVIYERGMTNAQAAANLMEVFRIALDKKRSNESAVLGPSSNRSQTFFERSSLKPSVEMIVNRTGVDVPYQHGYTLFPIVTSFIPRILWPSKPNVETGVLVNTQFHVTGDDITYISPSHLGEFYWNFGWPGAIVMMALLGIVMGRIGRVCDMSEAVSVTRLLIVAVTIFQLCIRFEGTVAGEYAVWIRSMIGILLLHWLFSRRTATSTTPGSIERGRPRVPANILR